MLTITGGQDEHSGVGAIKYNTTGVLSLEDRTLEGNIVTFSITQDGRTIVTAYTIDQAGNISEPATKEMKKDTVKPTATLNVKAGPWSIAAEVTAQDNLSGIYSYEIQYKKKNETNWQTGETKITTEETTSVTAKNLDALTEYYVKVTVKDKAGNEVTETQAATTTREPQVGDYVDYKPDYGEYTVEAKYSGHTADQMFTTQNLGWRIWEIDKENKKLTLVNTGNLTNSVILSGAQGYNNGVGILHDYGEKLYSNKKLNTIARSITLEDIKYALKKSNSNFVIEDKYNRQITKDVSVSVPLIHLIEEYASLSNSSTSINFNKGEGISRSSQPRNEDGTRHYYSGAEIDNSDGLTSESFVIRTRITELGGNRLVNMGIYDSLLQGPEYPDFYYIATRTVRRNIGNL